MQSDKYANDANTWAAQGETFGRAVSFQGRPVPLFSRSHFGHQALEMLLKASLIRHGGFKISKADGEVWVHRWEVNVDAGNGDLITTECRALPEQACLYQSAKQVGRALNSWHS
jgi:hypothetical protein